MIIWIASYPRSGNTLLRIILFHVFGIKTFSLYDDLADIGSDSKFADIVGHVPMPSEWTPQQAGQDSNLWLVKTHHPPGDDQKAIYVIRDGREASLSYWKYRRTFGGEAIDLASVIQGQVAFGSWSEHVKSWNPKDRPNTLLLRFEDLSTDPARILPLISAFLGRPLLQQEIPSFAQLQAVHPTFFRNGRTNSWTEAFSNDEHLLFWLLHGEVMRQYGYCHEIPEVFCGAPGRALADLNAVVWSRLQSKIKASLADATQKQWQMEWQSGEIVRCHEQIHQLKSQRAGLKNELRALRNSRSWKITKPLRSLARFVARLCRRQMT
ncbi:MAG: sulfotransferase domain-containing protein [Verrucomicrobiota bacterium]